MLEVTHVETNPIGSPSTGPAWQARFTPESVSLVENPGFHWFQREPKEGGKPICILFLVGRCRVTLLSRGHLMRVTHVTPLTSVESFAHNIWTLDARPQLLSPTTPMFNSGPILVE